MSEPETSSATPDVEASLEVKRLVTSVSCARPSFRRLLSAIAVAMAAVTAVLALGLPGADAAWAAIMVGCLPMRASLIEYAGNPSPALEVGWIRRRSYRVECVELRFRLLHWQSAAFRLADGRSLVLFRCVKAQDSLLIQAARGDDWQAPRLSPSIYLIPLVLRRSVPVAWRATTWSVSSALATRLTRLFGEPIGSATAPHD
jgi:hypothetical protein